MREIEYWVTYIAPDGMGWSESCCSKHRTFEEAEQKIMSGDLDKELGVLSDMFKYRELFIRKVYKKVT